VSRPQAARDPDAIKRRTEAHWSANPIASRHGEFHPAHDTFTREWFEEHSRFRYDVYGPWIREIAGFDRRRGDLLLEIGCGMGTDLLEFARGGARVVGVDLTRRHLELARRRFGFSGQSARLFQGDAERLPFPDRSFDFVYSNGVLHHTPDTEGALREVHRVLKPGGSCVILLYHRNSLLYRTQICGIWAAKAIAKRALGRGGRLRDFRLSTHVAETTDGAGNPLTRVFSARECRAMCRVFRTVRTRAVHLRREEVALVRHVPEPVRRWLESRWGWYVVIEATR
jgi:SAM-dependent methyltransferase